MTKPQTKTIFFLALAFLIASQFFNTVYYPAAQPVYGPDGLQVIGADGRPVFHRDMADYFRILRPMFALLACSGCLFAWWLLRVARDIYVNHRQRTGTTVDPQ